MTGIICLIIVLNRVLKMKYPKDRAAEFYNRTLLFFIFGVSISFVGMIIDMFANFMME